MNNSFPNSLEAHKSFLKAIGKMIVCPKCGNKRCNKATNAAYKCTGSNDPNQPVPDLESEKAWIGSSGYEQLVAVLQDAHNQAAHGKGKERHANNLPFDEQRMQSISKLINSPKGLEFQAIKKLTEGMQFDDVARREKELLGAINYIAGIIIYYRNGDV